MSSVGVHIIRNVWSKWSKKARIWAGMKVSKHLLKHTFVQLHVWWTLLLRLRADKDITKKRKLESKKQMNSELKKKKNKNQLHLKKLNMIFFNMTMRKNLLYMLEIWWAGMVLSNQLKVLVPRPKESQKHTLLPEKANTIDLWFNLYM